MKICLPRYQLNFVMMASVGIFLVSTLVSTFVHAADAGVKSCVCRKAKASRFLELHTKFEDGDEKIKQLQSFTIAGSKNEAQCLAAIKTLPECGGKAAELAAAASSLKLTAKMITRDMTLVGLKAGDVLQSIDKVPIAGEKDLEKFAAAEKSGSRIDASLLRGNSTLDVWYQFPKEEPAE